MENEAQDVQKARTLAANATSMLGNSPAFQRLPPVTQQAIYQDLGRIRHALAGNGHAKADPYAFPLDTPADRFARQRGPTPDAQPAPAQDGAVSPAPAPAAGARAPAATDALGKRVGNLTDEVNFPAFVASLIHGTYDAVVDASIRQMEAFGELVSAVAKDVDQFTEENVTRGQVLDWLAHQYPHDLVLDAPGGPNAAEPALHARKAASADGEGEEQAAPLWLSDYGLEGPLTDELIEAQLIPAARKKVGGNRMQTLATMVLLGLNRINIKDGSISAKVRFRAAASDRASVGYAVSQEPGGQNWGERGSAVYDNHTTMVSTVGANVQTDSELKAELFGEVRINFVSETLPLERFVDSARLAILQRNGRPQAHAAPAPAAQPLPAAPAPPSSPAAAPPPDQGGK